jgi:hypothetical protein
MSGVVFLGGRAVLAVIAIVVTFTVASQMVSDPTQALYFGGVSEFVGFVTFAALKVDVKKLIADASVILLFLPLFVILVLLPSETTAQAVNATTNWFVSYIQGVPASIMGDLGGSVAAAILALGN